MTDDQYHASRRKGFGFVRATRPDQCEGTGKTWPEASAEIARKGHKWAAMRCPACQGWHVKEKEAP